MNFFRIPPVLILVLFLSSCAKTPSHLILAPELNLPTVSNYQNKQAQLNVTDLRIARHIIQVLHKGEAADLMTSQQILSESIKQVLKKEFERQGLSLKQTANNETVDNEIEVFIDEALIVVNQETMSYQAKSNISLRIKVINTEQTLTKTFNSVNNRNGSLIADIAVLEYDFNQQLTNTLINILTNDEVIQFIK
jgi:uncharacterized lipoprotein|tara:strand:- start:611 stop:1192 length:582 start_codon:yes stop_codon:yes gene_type:complete